MTKPKFPSKDVIEMMVAFVSQYLQLDNRKGPDYQGRQRQSLTFTGRGPNDGHKFSLEVIVKTDRAASEDIFKRRVEQRASPIRRDERTYTALLFPKSIDYQASRVDFRSRYCRQVNLPSTIQEDEDLFNMYERFSHTDVKEVSRVEWEFAIPLGGGMVAYYNPFAEEIQVIKFRKFKEDTIIPADRPPDQKYFWYYVKSGRFPAPSNFSRSATVFRNIQQGRHDEVRKMLSTEHFNGDFTLQAYGKEGARLVVPISKRQLSLNL